MLAPSDSSTLSSTCSKRGKRIARVNKSAASSFPFLQLGPVVRAITAGFLGMGIDQHEDFSIHVDHELSIQKLADKFIPGNVVFIPGNLFYVWIFYFIFGKFVFTSFVEMLVLEGL